MMIKEELKFVCRSLFRGRNNGWVKVLTLTLGLSIGIVLFARIAFDLSYERFLPGVENLYQLQTVYTAGMGTDNPSMKDYGRVFRPVAPAMAEEIPGVVAGSSILDVSGEDIAVFCGENRYDVQLIYADTAFFRTLGIPILAGDPARLEVSDQIFLSRSLARRIFGEKNAVGEVLFWDKKQTDSYKIAGIFEDFPANSHLKFDMVCSIAPFSHIGWNNGDGFNGYVRLQPDADVERINSELLPALMAKHADVERWKRDGQMFSVYLKPLTELHTGNPETRQTLAVLSILAVLILVAISLNYVMLSISSLASRARTMAIHKCYGASAGNIFSMQFLETLMLVIASTILAALVIVEGKGVITSLTGVPMSFFLTGQQVAVSLSIVLFVVLLSGVLPAKIFAEVPVTQVFRFYRANKRGWRKGLLGVQIACATFMMVFLLIVLLQYDKMLDKDLGYRPENLVYCTLGETTKAERQKVHDELLRSTEVENVAFSSSLLPRFLNGTPLRNPETGEALATVRYMFVDANYLETIGVRLNLGNNLSDEQQDPTPMLVNQRLLNVLGWTDNPVGKTLPDFDGVVAGEMEDFYVGSIFDQQNPVALLGITTDSLSYSYLTVKLREMNPVALSNVENRLKELLPEQDIILQTYLGEIHKSYKDTKQFRNSVAVASVFMLLITLMGLLGYVADEIRRRGKEIAIRKVNGATAWDIERLLLRDIALVSLPAIVVALMGTFLAASRWLQHFPEQVALGFFLFFLSGVILFGVIAICVMLRGWGKANENPTVELKVNN